MGTHYNVGKELLYKEGDNSNHLGDMHSIEIANSLAARANHSKRVTGNNYDLDFDYPAKVAEKLSPNFEPENVSVYELTYALSNIRNYSRDLDVCKKLMFRGKSRSDMGLTNIADGSAASFDPSDKLLIHGIIGMITEAGELAELLLSVIEGATSDPVNALEECGDIGFYRQLVLTWLGITDHACNIANIEKLHGRFGGAVYNEIRDSVENRDLDAEHEKLSAHQTKSLDPKA